MDENDRAIDDPNVDVQLGSQSRHGTPSSPTQPAPPRALVSGVKRQWSSTLEGQHPWGSVEIGPRKQGFRNYRLIVFPPGISQVERRYVRMARAWPTWGTALLLLPLLCVTGALGPWMSLTVSVATYLGLGAVVISGAGRARKQVRTLSVVLIDRHHDPLSAERFALLETLVALMTQVDDLCARGHLSESGREVVWGRVYDCLAPSTSVSSSSTTEVN